jgi:Spy/CpxP family protein refolding chaperone
MRPRTFLLTALAFGLCLQVTNTPRLSAQSAQGVQMVEQLAGQLQLTPRQKAQLAPVLRSEAPKVQAIKADSSLSPMQKLEQLRAVHAQTDPQIKAILTPEQYSKLQEIRDKEIQQVVRKKLAR